ncbi:MAG: thymidine phosphorylase, partial [Pseudomonadota bacterium]|nr:thymidine phosphorylase [Pseudomonadota bacterium]
DERSAFTHSVAHSGDVFDWSNLGFDGPVVGKHSSGGVGDKVSLIVAPIMAAAGAYMPKLSGRGLGHTGGTLDKLEAIPDVNTSISQDRLEVITKDIGFAIVGATGKIAPADKVMYGIRDVTATVMSIDLIAMSIMGKKLAEGTEALVLDVKAGSGAFMKTKEQATALAKAMWEIADRNGLKARAVVSDMNEVLGDSAGNALEVEEAIAFLKDPSTANLRLKDVCTTLCTELMTVSGLADNVHQAEQKMDDILRSGQAAEKFGQLIHALGGPVDFMENSDAYLPKAPIKRFVSVDKDVCLMAMDTEEIGKMIANTMGGGRQKVEDPIDYAVGITNMTSLGSKLKSGDIIATIHASTEAQADAAEARLRKAVTLSEENAAYTPNKTILEIVGAS